jgi:Glycosyl transferase family 2
LPDGSARPNTVEWIAYHRMIGLTDIVVCQNDSFDSTPRTLRQLAALGVIRYIDNTPGWQGFRTGFQNRAYCRASRTPEFAVAAWCRALDGDEFLRANVGTGTLADLIAAVGKVDEVRINWRVFGSSHLRDLDDRLVTKRFRMASEMRRPSRYPIPVKTLFRAAIKAEPAGRQLWEQLV